MLWELRKESVSTVPYRTGSLPEAPRMYIIREQWLAYAFRWLLAVPPFALPIASAPGWHMSEEF